MYAQIKRVLMLAGLKAQTRELEAWSGQAAMERDGLVQSFSSPFQTQPLFILAFQVVASSVVDDINIAIKTSNQDKLLTC